MGNMGGGSGGGVGWIAPATATGTGEPQTINLPETALNISDVLVFVDGEFQHTGYAIVGSQLQITASLGSQILVARYGVGQRGPLGPKGDKGDRGYTFTVKGEKNSMGELPASANESEAWLVDGHLIVWQDGVWFDSGNIRGPQGIQGPQGEQGSEGPQGPQGAPGEAQIPPVLDGGNF